MFGFGLDVVLAALYARDIPRPTVCSRKNLYEIAKLWRATVSAICLESLSGEFELKVGLQPENGHAALLSEFCYRHGLGAEAAAIGNSETLRVAISKCASGSLVTCVHDRYPRSWANGLGGGYPVLQIRESRPPYGYQSILKAESIRPRLEDSPQAPLDGPTALPSEAVLQRTSLQSIFDATFSKLFLGVVGSRNIDAARAELVQAVVQAAASRGFAICSGGAPGADRAAIHEASHCTPSFELWPCGVEQRWGVEADWATNRASSLDSGFGSNSGASPPVRYLPLTGSFVAQAEPFDRRHAMERNAALYSMSSATFVAHARFKEGGSWHGAVTALRRRLCRVIVPMDGSPAHRALVSLGAIPFDLTLPVPVALENALEAEPLQPWLAFQLPPASAFDGHSTLF